MLDANIPDNTNRQDETKSDRRPTAGPGKECHVMPTAEASDAETVPNVVAPVEFALRKVSVADRRKSPDHRLIALGEQLTKSWSNEIAAYADETDLDCELTAEVFGRVTSKIGKRIARISPITLEGLLVKARLRCYRCSLNAVEPSAAAIICSDELPDDSEDFLRGFVSIFTELLRLHPELKGIPSAELMGCPTWP